MQLKLKKNLNQLKDTLNDKLTGLSQIVRPNVDQPLKEANTKLKEALRVAVKTNAQVLKQFDELSLHYSFMPRYELMLIVSVKLYSIGLTSLNTLDLSISFYV